MKKTAIALAVVGAFAMAANAAPTTTSETQAKDGLIVTTKKTVKDINPTPIYSPFLLPKIAGLHIDV